MPTNPWGDPHLNSLPVPPAIHFITGIAAVMPGKATMCTWTDRKAVSHEAEREWLAPWTEDLKRIKSDSCVATCGDLAPGTLVRPNAIPSER